MNYYKEINKKAKLIKDNNDTLITYWNVGKLIVEAQGGTLRAKYGNNLVKEWSEKLVSLYGNSYNSDNLRRFRQFYITFPKYYPAGHTLNWSQI